MIRPYLKKDKNALIELLNLNIPQFFDESEVSDFIEYLEKHIESYFIAEIEGKIIGCGGINYKNQQKKAIISWDIIHPDFQGKGIGKKLLLYRINEIKKNKLIETIIVRTSQHADKFYEKCGFKLEKVEKDYWAKDFDLYEMIIKIYE